MNRLHRGYTTPSSLPDPGIYAPRWLGLAQTQPGRAPTALGPPTTRLGLSWAPGQDLRPTANSACHTLPRGREMISWHSHGPGEVAFAEATPPGPLSQPSPNTLLARARGSG